MRILTRNSIFMNSNQNFNTIEKAFFSDGFKLGMQAVKANLSTKALFSSISAMYFEIDKLIKSITQLAQQNKQPVHCKKGCDYCCHQPVYALDYEMQFLNLFIKETFTEKRQKEIQVRSNKNLLKLSELDKTQILNSKQPCPLLENGMCLAYEARPMACRIYLSTNVNTCHKYYNEPEDKINFPALLDFPMRAGRMMNEGFKAALKTKGVVTNEFRIDEKLIYIQ